MATQEVPLGACVLSVLAGTLIALQGSLLVAGAEGAQPFVPASFSSTLTGLGGLALVEGVLVIVAAFLLLFSPRFHTGAGIAILTFSLLSVGAGGGFFLGALFGYVGGVLGILYVPRIVPPAGLGAISPEPESDEDDPVVEADLVDSGILPRSSPEPSDLGPASREPAPGPVPPQ